MSSEYSSALLQTDHKLHRQAIDISKISTQPEIDFYNYVMI